ncbi:hypothetical protein swp_1635 [Shewanella piezotolerans WP3]|uniref:Uncharacterized protein n=1 Tax=Shewanella piezotolerans (strain WP3 / JCM 13877) TaxID=225849 RepID=B8CL87_SHEPW|nr:hypothetical protein swp_1635 [Shewanella piezotolerans WP3]
MSLISHYCHSLLADKQQDFRRRKLQYQQTL